MSNLGGQGVFYTDQLPAGLRIAQVVGLTSTAFFAGKTFTQSFSTTPALLHAPAPLLAKQWQTMFNREKALSPVFAAVGTGVFGFLAYREPEWTRPAVLYAAASAAVAAVVPYTLLVAEPIHRQLAEKAQSLASAALTDAKAEAGVAQEQTTHALVDQWATVNLGRALLTGIGAVLATWAAVDRGAVVPATLGVGAGAGRMGW